MVTCTAVVAGCGRVGFDSIQPEAITDGSPAAAACPAGALLCDGFESGDLSKWTGKRGTGGTLAVTGVPVHSGAFALEAELPAQPNTGNERDVFFAIASHDAGTLAVRAWTNAQVPTTHYDGLLYLTNSASPQYAEVSGDDDSMWTVNSHNASTDHDLTSATAVGAVGTWTCVELDYTFAPTPSVALFVDDAPILTGSPQDASPAFDRVALGVTRSALAGYHVLIDDVVIAEQHIGCVTSR